MTAIRPAAVGARTELAAPARQSAGSTNPGRILSLDWARGSLIVFNLVAISAVGNAWPAFVHGTWDEPVPAIDVIFPAFVTLSGAGLAFAYRNNVRWTRTVRRTVLLLAAGLAYNACHAYLAGHPVSPATLRYTGPLTMYAVLVPVIAILHRVIRSWPWWALFTVAAAAVYTVVLTTYAAGCPGAALTPQCNPSGVIDPLVLGAAHVYGAGAPGHDPEGLIATFGALSSAAAGVTAAHLLLWARPRGAPWVVSSLGGLAGALWLLGTALGVFVPEFKRLWTPPFGLHVAAGVILVLAAGSLVLDRPRTHSRWRAAVWPVVGTGRNALVLYFGSHLLLALLRGRGDPLAGRPWIVSWAETFAVGGVHPQVAFTATFVAAGLVLASTLHRYKIYIRP